MTREDMLQYAYSGGLCSFVDGTKEVEGQTYLTV